MGKLFGTDGVRGVAGKDLTADLAYKLGIAVSEVLTDTQNHKPKIVIGKDTRLSGDMFESAISAGLCAMGSDVILLGVVPTPAVAFLVKYLSADAGIMISASHNPSEYNGIKIFNENGFKLSDELENKIENIILDNIKLSLSSGSEIGRVYTDKEILSVYNNHISSIFKKNKNINLSTQIRKRKILFDLSNGSASITAKKIFTSDKIFGYDANFIAYDPDGININDNCGSTQMEKLSEMVKNGDYDIGIAFDGDADRCLITDENGKLIDGDGIIALFAQEMKKEGTLANDSVVVTCLSNLGFHIMAKEQGLNVKVTDVGDRFVLEEMVRGGYNLGGEQSGHIILTDYATTGDGQATAATIINILTKYSDKEVSEIFSCMKSLPQISINVKVPIELKKEIVKDSDIIQKVKDTESQLNGKGRILLRPSGTEALIRIMLEGEKEEELVKMGHIIADMIKNKIL